MPDASAFAPSAVTITTVAPSTVQSPQSNCTLPLATDTLSDCTDLLDLHGGTAYTLTNDIDCNGITSSGSLANNNLNCIVIDGQKNSTTNYKISNFTVNNTSRNYMGLIEQLRNSILKNLDFENFNIKGKYGVGIVGGSQNSSFENLSLNNIIVEATRERAGALVGNMEGSYSQNLNDYSINADDTNVLDLVANYPNFPKTISNVNLTNSSVKAGTRVGGLVGSAKDTVANEISATNVVVDHGGTYSHAGGIFGLGSTTANNWSDITGSNIEVKARSSASGLLSSFVRKDTVVNNVNITNSNLLYLGGSNNNSSSIGGLIGEYYQDGVRLKDILVKADIKHVKDLAPFNQIGSANIDKVGGIVGYANSTDNTFENVKFEGTITGFDDEVGGIVGASNGNLTISNSDAIVTIDSNVNHDNSLNGGLIGANYSGAVDIDKTCAVVDIDATDDEVGGFAGRIGNSIDINQSFVKGTINGAAEDVGSFVGFVVDANNVIITDSYSKVNLSTTDDNAGGFIGEMDSSSSSNVTINTSYFDGNLVTANDDDEYPLVGEVNNNDDGINVTFNDAYFSSSANFAPTLATNFNTSSTNNSSGTVAQKLNSTDKNFRANYVGFDFNSIWYNVDGLSTPELRFKITNYPVSSITLDQNAVVNNGIAGLKVANVTVVDPETDPVTCVLQNSPLFTLDVDSNDNISISLASNLTANVGDVLNLTIECTDFGSQRAITRVFPLNAVANITGQGLGPALTLADNTVDPQIGDPQPLACPAATSELVNNGFDINNNGLLEDLEKLRLASKLNLLIQDSKETSAQAATLATNYPEFDLNDDNLIDNFDRILDYADCDIQVHRFLHAAEILDTNRDGKLPKKKLNNVYKKQFKKARKEFLFDRNRNLATVDTNSFYDLFDYNEDDKINKKDKRYFRQLLRQLRNISIFAAASSSQSDDSVQEDLNNDELPADIVTETSVDEEALPFDDSLENSN